MSVTAEEMERRKREREAQEYRGSQASKLPPIPEVTEGNLLEVVASLRQREMARGGELRGFRSDTSRTAAIIEGRIGDQIASAQDVFSVPLPTDMRVSVIPLSGIFVTWGATRFQTQIYRQTTPNTPDFSQPIRATVSGSVYFDDEFLPGEDLYYYWIRHVHTNSDGTLVSSGWLEAGSGRNEDLIGTPDIDPDSVTVPQTLDGLDVVNSGSAPSWVEEGGVLRLETTEFQFDVDLDNLDDLNAVLINLDYSVLARQEGEGVADTQLSLSGEIELRVSADLMYGEEVLKSITPGNGQISGGTTLVGSNEEETYSSLVYSPETRLFLLPDVSPPELKIRFRCTITSSSPIDIPLNSEQARNEFVFEFTKGDNMWYVGLKR